MIVFIIEKLLCAEYCAKCFVQAKSLQLYPTLCNSMVCSPPDSSVHGILQAGRLGWVAMSSPEDLPSTGIEPWSPALQADSLPLSHQGSGKFWIATC